MEQMLLWCITAVLGSGAVLCGSWCVQRFAGRFCLRRDAERREKYLNSVLWMLFSGTEECAHCPEAMSSRDRRLIAEDIADLVDSTYGLDPAPLRRMSSVRGLMFSCCVVFAAMEVTAGLITCICFPECPSMKKQFGQWNVIRIAGTVMSASVR